MARQSNNHVMRGTRGMFGKQIVFKIRKGKGFVSAPPNICPYRTPTPNQQNAQNRFRHSTDYANEAIKDEQTKFMYQQVAGKRQSAQNMAFKDAYHPPEILTVITQGYTGSVGSIIVAHVIDDFRVTVVKVVIERNGSLIEEGSAVQHGDLWVYTATAENDPFGCIVRISAFDVPENKTTLDILL